MTALLKYYCWRRPLATFATGVPTHTTSYQYDGANRLIQGDQLRGSRPGQCIRQCREPGQLDGAQGSTEARTTSRYDVLGRGHRGAAPEGSFHALRP